MSDICCELPLTPSEAVLGGDVKLTLDGRVKMKLPPGVTSGKRFGWLTRAIRPEMAIGAINW